MGNTPLSILLLLLSLSLAPVGMGQTCLLGHPLTSPNQGVMNGALYCDLTVHTTVTLTRIGYVASDGSSAGNSSMNVYVGPGTWEGNVPNNPGAWHLVAATTPFAIPGGVDTPVTGVLVPAGINTGPVTFAPGHYGVALQAVGHSWGYQNGAATFTAPGSEFSVTTGAASATVLIGGVFAPRTMNGWIDYTPGGAPMSFPHTEPYGDGCYWRFQSLYEYFPNSAAVDLGNTSMLWTLDTAGNRWSSVTAGATPMQPVMSPSLSHSDESWKVVNLANNQPIAFPSFNGIQYATTSVRMSDNGYVDLATLPVGALAVPTVAWWLIASRVSMGNLHQLDPSAGGSTHYDFDVATSAHLFSWSNVPTSNAPGTSTSFQMAFFANGNVEFRWGALSLAGSSHPTLVGFTRGHGALDPGSVDLSAALPTSTWGSDHRPLELTVTGSPSLGATIQLATQHVTGTSVGLCLLAVSDLPSSPIGLDLAAIGAPGCAANVVFDVAGGLTVGELISNLGAPFPGLSVPLTIPTSPLVLGLRVYAQSVWLDPMANALGLLTSNAFLIAP